MNYSTVKIFILLIFILAGAMPAGAQVKTDTLKQAASSVLKDSTAADTSKLKKKNDFDAVVYSTASDSMIMNAQTRKMRIYGKGEIKYKQTDLKGGQIFVDYNSSELEAYGVPDSTGKKFKDTPVLKDGNQSYEGQKMRYNFKTQQGFISAASSKEKDTRYEGEKVKKVDKETFFIENGIFTTCDEKDPHTYFSAEEMKVITNDKIIAKWVFMYIAGIPLPIPLPMAVIPNQTGRRSGIIIPGYGNDINRGLYLSHLGYYFALSDYYDLALSSDLYSRGGYGLKGRIRYNKRYDFSGEFNAGFSNISTNSGTSREWNLSLSHNQKLDPTSSLVAQMQFRSQSYNTYNTYNYNDLMQQQVFSSATFSKIFEDFGASMSVSYNRSQNMKDGTYSENLPSVDFSKQLFYPFKSKSKGGIINTKWYELIGVNYSANFENQRVKSADSLAVHAGLRHNLALNFSTKVGYFSLTPSVNYVERWYNKRLEKAEVPYDSAGTTKYRIVDREINEFNFVRNFSLSLSTSTKLYGILPANGFLGIEAFRHTITPMISYNYTPDFSSDRWGYYGTLITHDGKKIRYDKFSNEVYGGAGSGESQSISFGIGNIFELKTAKDPTDTTSQSNKIQLLNFSVSSGYNFARDSIKLSDMNASFRTQVSDLLDFSGSANYTFYDIDRYGNSINKYLSSAGKGLFRITNFNFTISTNLSPEKLRPSAGGQQQLQPVNTGDMSRQINKGLDMINPNAETSADYSIPWNLGFSFNYNSNMRNPAYQTKTASMMANFSMNLTKKWKFTIYGNYDFETKQVSAPQVTVNRDLHCWEMNLTWRPLGLYRGFYFIIRMKAPEFQDIKIEKTDGQFSGLR